MRKIKARDVKPGMEIEWTKDGVRYRLTPQSIVAFRSKIKLLEVEGDSTTGYNMCTEGGGVQYVTANHEVTVLSEPQPDEPTEFGACVEAGGVWFVRRDVWGLSDPDFQPWQSESLIQFTWAEVCDHGPVTVVNADPFASTEPRQPRVWDRWADVPDGVTVRPTDVENPYRKVGDRIECKRGGPWVPAFAGEYDLNKYSPFTEALDA